jgi:hypothetical protein
MRRRQAYWRTRASDGELGVELISRDEYNEWRSLQRLAPIAVAQDRAETDELVIDLAGLAAQLTDDAAVEPWRPVIGGNAAGFVTLLDDDGVETPPAPAAINITAYEEHLDSVLATLQSLLEDRDFRRDAEIRYLTLEGRDAYDAFYSDEPSQALAAMFSDAHPTGTELGDVIEAAAFQQFMRGVPMSVAPLDAIES